MVRDFEQLYEEAAEDIADILYRSLPGDFHKVWISMDLLSKCSDMTCLYSPEDQPDRIVKVTDNNVLLHIYLAFGKLYNRMSHRKEGWTRAYLLIYASGEFSIELNTEDLFEKLERAEALENEGHTWIEDRNPLQVPV